MNQLHQLLRVFSVLFAVAQEDVRVKGGSDLLCQLVAGDDGFQIFRQLLLIRDRRRVGVVLVEILQIAEFLVEHVIQSAFLHQRQDRNVIFKRERHVHVHRTVGFDQQLCCYGNYKQLHLTQA